MAGPNSHLRHDPTRAASLTGGRKSWLVRILFCAGLTAVVLVLEPLMWRLGRGSHSTRPSARPPRQTAPETERGSEEWVRAAPIPLLGAQEEEQRASPGQAAGAEPSPAAPKTAQADQIVEQRLRASEEDLRAELRRIPELRLLSDGAVQKVREAEQAAETKAVEAPRAVQEAARANVDAANARLKALRTALNRNPRDLGLASAERQAAEVARLAQLTSLEVNLANRPANSVSLQERENIRYEGSMRLYRTLKSAAVRAGLPLQSGPACQLAPTTAAQVAKLSQDLRDQGFVSLPGVPSPVPFRVGGIETSKSVTRQRVDGVEIFKSVTSTVIGSRVTITGPLVQPGTGLGSPAGPGEKAFADWCDQHRLEKMSGTVPTLTQMLQIENEAKRLLLVRELTRVPGAAATKQLAVRAIADLSPSVRRAAVAGLEKRPWREYSPVLVRGLRYPWSPVADHAAVALRALNRPEAVTPLVDMLDLPSPSSPVLDPETKKYTACELVRLNHLRNCLLCHAPSASKEDGPIRGLVPTLGEPLPVAYYQSQAGHFVRADRTYLRQDFSVILPAEEAGHWPHQQRYDFVIRRRTLPPSQVTDSVAAPSSYPQRDAVLYALRGLTGKDGGDSSARWRELLGLSAEMGKGAEKRPALEGSIVPLADAVRPR